MVRYSEIIQESEEDLSVRMYNRLSNFYDMANVWHIDPAENNIDIESISGNLIAKEGISNFPNIVIKRLLGGRFIVKNTRLKNLINAPLDVWKDIVIQGNSHLESLEGLPKGNIEFLQVLKNDNLKSLKGIKVDSQIKYCDITCSPILPILRLLVVQKAIYFKTDDIMSEQTEYLPLQHLINKYIHNESMSLSEKRIRCKLELLEYPEYGMNATW